MRAFAIVGALFIASVLASCTQPAERPSASACWADDVKLKLSTELKPELASAVLAEFARQAPAGSQLPSQSRVEALLKIRGAEFSAVMPDAHSLAMVCNLSLDVTLTRADGKSFQANENKVVFLVYPGEHGPTPDLAPGSLDFVAKRLGPLVP